MVYYEAYKHVIQAMTTMKKLPFGETLFKTCDNPTGNFVKQHEESIDFPVNESQLRAIKLGLENKIALIQGPPGICDFFFVITKRKSTHFAFNYSEQSLSII